MRERRSRSFETHEEYFAAQPVAVRGLLERVQQEVEKQVPGATRTTGYDMPAFKRERIFFYFASFKKHLGIYPPVRDEALIAETAAFRGPKGNLSFPYSQELPIALIGRVAVALAAQYGAR